MVKESHAQMNGFQFNGSVVFEWTSIPHDQQNEMTLGRLTRFLRSVGYGLSILCQACLSFQHNAVEGLNLLMVKVQNSAPVRFTSDDCGEGGLSTPSCRGCLRKLRHSGVAVVKNRENMRNLVNTASEVLFRVCGVENAQLAIEVNFGDLVGHPLIIDGECGAVEMGGEPESEEEVGQQPFCSGCVGFIVGIGDANNHNSYRLRWDSWRASGLVENFVLS
jgi:hypothetical protein